MPLMLVHELFEVNHSKIKENNGLNPRPEFSLRQNPTLLSVWGITNVWDWGAR